MRKCNLIVTENLIVRCEKLFKAKHGRCPTKDIVDRSCLPQTQAESEWLSGLSDTQFDEFEQMYAVGVRSLFQPDSSFSDAMDVWVVLKEMDEGVDGGAHATGIIGSEQALRELLTQMESGEGRFSGLDAREQLDEMAEVIMNAATVGYAESVAAKRSGRDPDDMLLINLRCALIQEAHEIFFQEDDHDTDRDHAKAVPDEASLLELASVAEDREWFRERLSQHLTLGYAKELSELGSGKRLCFLSLRALEAALRVAREHGFLQEGNSDA